MQLGGVKHNQLDSALGPGSLAAPHQEIGIGGVIVLEARVSHEAPQSDSELDVFLFSFFFPKGAEPAPPSLALYLPSGAERHNCHTSSSADDFLNPVIMQSALGETV